MNDSELAFGFLPFFLSIYYGNDFSQRERLFALKKENKWRVRVKKKLKKTFFWNIK